MLKNNYKTALVTGASSGIGEETVKLLVKNNIKVYAVARRKNKLIKLEKTTGCIPIVMDIRDKKALEKLIGIGDTITRERKMIEMGDCLNCKSLDNRVSVFILIEVLKKIIKTPPYDIYAVFTVQEEIGIRGANVSSMQINPDFGFGLDTTIAWDTPGSTKQEQVSALGEGACIKVMDSSTVCDYRMVAYMKEVAKKNKIKTQLEILPAGGTDTSGIQRMNPGGSIAGAVSIPTRHIHQVIEMVNKNDVKNSIDLLKACVENLDSYDWSF